MSPPGLPLGSHVLEAAPAVVVTSVPIGECPGGAQEARNQAREAERLSGALPANLRGRVGGRARCLAVPAWPGGSEQG